MKSFFCNFVIALAIFCLCSSFVSAAEVEKTNNFGYIYWYGGEDVSYNKDTSNLVSIDDFYNDLDVDMYIDMDLADMEDGTDGKSCVIKSIPEQILRPSDKTPVIAIIIDDMGVNTEKTASVLESIKQPVTMSFLPYADNVQVQVNKAKEKGHEIILHLPWEPERDSANPGPGGLLTSDSHEILLKKLAANLDAFKGYSGINNHMGSKFSIYRDGVEVVMNELSKRHLFFLDSKTTDNSIAEKIAYEYNVPSTHRNVFLDHIETSKFVANALKEVERIANSSGSAIAIGHPKGVTINALAKWLPTLEARGFKVVKLERIIKERQTTFNAKADQLDNKAKN